MIKLSFLLKEIIINEFNKSQLDFIASKLNLKRDSNFDSLMNALDSQGIKYLELKDKINNNEITSFEDLKALKTQSKSDVAKNIKSDSEKVYEDDNFLIIVPFTHAASCYYGAGTKWCTTDEDIDYWRRYILNNNDTLYYILDKKLPESNSLYKVAVVVDSNGSILNVYDALDKSINIKKYFDGINKKVKYDLRDKVDFKPKYEEIAPFAHKELENNLQKYIDKKIADDESINLFGAKITALPPGLKEVPFNLDLQDTLITALPPGLKKVGGNLILNYAPITSLPKNLTIGSALYLEDTPITTLPPGLKVRGIIVLTNSKIESLPPDLECQDIYLMRTPLADNYNELERIKTFKGIKGKIYSK
jgi:hypothetical protein